MTIHMFYSQLIDIEEELAVKAFAVVSGLSEEVIGGIVSAEEKKGGLIAQYNSGNIDTLEFRTKLKEQIKIEGGIQLEDDAFDICWNVMCIVYPIRLEGLYKLQSEHNNCKIHIIGCTNKLQHVYW